MYEMHKNFINLLINILGSAWVEKELDKYNSFRHLWSPNTRWYHRRPTLSPIVPILYWNLRDSFEGIQEPFGFWGGYPEEIFNRLGEEIDRFRDFWEVLPDNRGIDNLRWALTSPQRFFSLCHELSTSFFLAARPGIQVEPLFLDSRSTKGQPDLLVKTLRREFAVQCKSEDPSKARQLPYDLFQYLAGIFQRLVEDSGKSYHLSLHLKKNINIEHVSRIRKRAEKLIKRGITTPYPWNTTYCDFELTEIGKRIGALTLDQIRRQVLNQPGDPLYQEFVGIEDDKLIARARRLASLFISGRRGKELDWFISTAVTKSVMEANTTLPLIIAIHLYQEIDFGEYQSRPSYKQQLLPWTNNFFKEYPNVAMIFISSNRELYFARGFGDDKIALKHARQGLVVESPEWDHSEVEELGI